MATPYSELPEHVKEQRRRAHRRWIKNNPGIRKKYYEKYEKTRPQENKLLRASKDRARLNNLPHNLTVEDIVIPTTCPICDTELEVSKTRGGSARSPSLDKIQPHLGYVKGNVAILCKKCNSMKGDASVELLEKMIDYIKSHIS